MSCSVGRRCGSDLAVLWLWCRLAAVALIGSLAREPPYATGAALKKPKKKKKKIVPKEQKLLQVEDLIVHHQQQMFGLSGSWKGTSVIVLFRANRPVPCCSLRYSRKPVFLAFEGGF